MGIFSRVLSGVSEFGKDVRAPFIGALKGAQRTPELLSRAGAAVGERLSKDLTPALNALGVSSVTKKVAEALPQGIKRSLPSVTETVKKGVEASKPEGFGEQVGFLGEQIAETFLPGSAGSKIASKIAPKAFKAAELAGKAKGTVPFTAKALKEGATAIGEGLVGGATSIAQGADKKQAVTSAGVSAAFPVVGFGLKTVGNVARTLVPQMSKLFTGVPVEAYDKLIKDPGVVLERISKASKDGDEFTQELYSSVANSLDSLDSAKAKNYKKQIEKFTKNDGSTTSIAQNTVDEIGSGFEKVLNDYKFVVNPKEGTKKGVLAVDVDFDQSFKRFTPAQRSEVQNMVSDINRWDDYSPIGFNDLRRKIGDYYKGGADTKEFDGFVTKMKKELSKRIYKAYPKLAKINKEFHLSSDFIDGLRKELSFKDTNLQTTGLRKLVNAFNKKNDFYRKAVKELGEKTANDFLADIAALSFSQLQPEGLSRVALGLSTGALGVAGAAFGAPDEGALEKLKASTIALPLLTFASPRLSAYAVGYGSKALKSKAAQSAASAVSGLKQPVGALSGRVLSAPQEEVDVETEIKPTDPRIKSFVEQARLQGFTDEELNAYLLEKGLPPLTELSI